MLEGIKAIFFDLDDTLINFGGVTKEAWDLTCQSMIKHYPRIKINALDLSQHIYIKNETLWADEKSRPKGNVDFNLIRLKIVKDVFNELGIEDQEALLFLVSNYALYKQEAIYLFPKVHETLDELHKRGYKLVLITNGDGQRQREKVQRFDLEKHFDFILIEGEQEYGKPDLRIYQKALDLCEVKANEACMVGDNYLWEVEAPIKYGLKGVWLNTSQKDIPMQHTYKPDLMIESISELLEI